MDDDPSRWDDGAMVPVGGTVGAGVDSPPESAVVEALEGIVVF